VKGIFSEATVLADVPSWLATALPHTVEFRYMSWGISALAPPFGFGGELVVPFHITQF
jgi:hypothetical protein